MLPRSYSKGYLYKNLINLQSPIIPGKSIGNLFLQTPFSELRDWIMYCSSDYFNSRPDLLITTTVRLGIEIEYSIKCGALNFVVDILSGTIIQIHCRQGYQGQLSNRVGIGSRLFELLELGHSFDVYNNCYIMAPEIPGFYIELPEEFHDYDQDLRGLPNFPIEKIGIFSQHLDGHDVYSQYYGYQP